LSAYSIKKQSNGAGNWINEFPLSGTINVNDVFVTINYQADDATLLKEVDLLSPESGYGAPINFNGNDPVGLFKNGVLIDIIGVLGVTQKNYENMTLRRKNSVTAPTITFNANEWDQLPQNTVDGIGYHGDTASTSNYTIENISMYPNPTNGNTLNFNLTKDATVKIYNVLGKLVKTSEIQATNNTLDISSLVKGMYILKINSNNQFTTKKLLIN
jgi:hypothetical protein